MEKERFLYITQKYASGTITPEEEAELIKKIDSSPEYRTLFKETVDGWIPPAAGTDYDRKWEQIRAVIQPPQQQAIPKKQFSLYRYWQVAAAIVVIVLGTFTVYLLDNSRSVTNGESWISEAAGKQDKSFMLPDSSAVYLRAGSVLSYYIDNNQRRVKLEGEAFFDVEKNPLAPFTVESEGLTVRVLGTSFSVDNRSEEGVVSVILLEGKVSLLNEVQEEVAMLAPGQKANYSTGQNNCEITEVDSDRLTLWRKGIVIYEGVTLDELLQLLGEHFPGDFKAADPVDDKQRFSGAFRKTQSLETVINQIEKLTGSKIILMNNE